MFQQYSITSSRTTLWKKERRRGQNDCDIGTQCGRCGQNDCDIGTQCGRRGKSRQTPRCVTVALGGVV